MNCDDLRNRVVAEGAERSPEIEAHLTDCPECGAFASRVALAHESLRAHHAEHLPDPYFAQRVSALVQGGSEGLGWAALKLLPATLALVLAMTAWCWLATPGPSELVESSPSEDVLGWVLEESGS